MNETVNYIPFTKKEIDRLWDAGEKDPSVKEEDRISIHYKGVRTIKFPTGFIGKAKCWVREDMKSVNFVDIDEDGSENEGEGFSKCWKDGIIEYVWTSSEWGTQRAPTLDKLFADIKDHSMGLWK